MNRILASFVVTVALASTVAQAGKEVRKPAQASLGTKGEISVQPSEIPGSVQFEISGDAAKAFFEAMKASKTQEVYGVMVRGSKQISCSQKETTYWCTGDFSEKGQFRNIMGD